MVYLSYNKSYHKLFPGAYLIDRVSLGYRNPFSALPFCRLSVFVYRN